MQDYNFIDGLQGSLLDAETRRFFALEKLNLTVLLHREQAARDREQAARELRSKKLEEWGFDPLYLEFLCDESIESILYQLEMLHEYE